jgi:hypothetical protein
LHFRIAQTYGPSNFELSISSLGYVTYNSAMTMMLLLMMMIMAMMMMITKQQSDT